MGISIADNFAYNGKKPLDNRTEYATLSAMKAVADASINEGCLAYNKEDGKYYKFLSTNTVDATTGKWREFSAGGGGGGGHTIQDDGVDMTARDNLNFVGFNVTDDSTNNRTTVTFPNIDLSVLSNEANIIEEGEKPVGMWKDRKLLWQKTVIFNSAKSINTGEWTVLDTISNGGNIASLVLYRDTGAGNTTGVLMTPSECFFDGSNLMCLLSIPEKPVTTYGYTLRYTKTTDSPLPAGVKFAGVLSDGTVVYKKTVSTGGSVPSGATLIYRLPLLNSTDVVYYTLAS